ncbi:zinc finger protein DZIP1 [Anoplophora glabripennis]|uniref:zinc finger protein DZIP1 n=1 Tax=Anoplophora glabripennis TaxID=217634 RepID=UPI0008757C7C|nr:zinc finger protein DZIP1 [Anoplophora glabripennis]
MSADDYKWHFDYVRLAWDAGFSFEKYKYSNLDKNKICLVDIDRIIKERDVASVERFLSTVVQYVLENDQAELLDTNFVKMFRISQLSVEYLLFCKKYLDNTVVLLKKEISKLKEENKELKLFVEELETHISALTKHSCVATFKCDKCPKAFSSEEYLNSHIKRRHNDENRTSTNAETDQLQSEIKQLKERLNITEKLLQEKDEQTQNVKLKENENENKLKVIEILEKFEKFKDKVEYDIKMLQIEKNFYEEKYSKLFDVVLESNKKENVNTESSQQPRSVSKDQIQQQEKSFLEHIVDKIETTTQTEKENIPTKNLQIETVHNKNIFEFKDMDKDSDSTLEKNNIQDTIEQKITQFEEQLESKISSGLNNIEKQMQAFWGKLSEIELQREVKVEEEVQITPPQELIRTETSKPKIKPRMKFSKPSKLVGRNEDNAKKIKAEIERMYVKPETTAVSVKNISESNLKKISNVLYNSSPSPELQKRSSSDSTSDSESSSVEVEPKKVHDAKPSVSTLGKRSLTSLKKAAQSKEVTEKLREEINNIINNRLQDIGISPNWNGIPQKTFEKAMEIVRHQANITKKSYPEFDSIKKSIEKSLKDNKDIAQKTRNRVTPTNKQANVINIRYRKKPKELKSEAESKSLVTIKNRSLYDTDSDSEDLRRPTTQVKSPKKLWEAAPSYSAVIQELKASQTKNVDTDSDVNSIILPKEDVANDMHTKSALKNYPSMGSLTKKKVLFDIESDKIEVDKEARGSLTSIDSSDVLKEGDNEKKMKKNESSLSDFDFSEL